MIKPYYEDARSGITIYHSNWREILPQLPKVDLVLADPPYGMDWNTDSRRFSGGKSAKIRRHPRGSGKKHKRVYGDDKMFDPSPWLGFDNVVLWGSNHYGSRLPVGTVLVWIKKHPELFHTFLSDCEVGWMKGGCGVYAFYKQFPPPLRAMELGGDPSFPITRHPNQKPISLMQWCIGLSKSSGLILDPYMGSGTTLRAAKDLGRRAIGIDIDEEYCEISVRRLQQECMVFESQ